MFTGVKKILVIKLRHIGDVLLAVPAIRALKESFPSAAVSALVNAGTEEMLTLNPLIKEVIVFDRGIKSKSLTGRIGSELDFVGGLRKRGFDMTVDLTGGDRPALIGFSTGARYRLGYDPKGSGFTGKRLLYTHLAKKPSIRTHTVLRDLGVLGEFGVTTKNLAVDIYASASDEAFVEGLLEANGIRKNVPFVHAHPTSRWMFKCWTDEGMAAILDRLHGAGYRVVITSGPDAREVKKVRSIISLMKSAPVDLSGRLSLKHLACLSRRAFLFFGVDTAPMHIAAAAGARVVGIFGPSGAFDWGPWDNRRSGARLRPSTASDGLESHSPYPDRNGIQRSGRNTVIQLNWDCIPCGKDGCKSTKKSDCLDRIEPPLVWNVLRDVIGNIG